MIPHSASVVPCLVSCPDPWPLPQKSEEGLVHYEGFLGLSWSADRHMGSLLVSKFLVSTAVSKLESYYRITAGLASRRARIRLMKIASKRQADTLPCRHILQQPLLGLLEHLAEGSSYKF